MVVKQEQKGLANEKRRKSTTPERMQELQAQTAQLNAALRQTRKDLKLCDDVLERSLLIKEKNRVLELQKLQEQQSPQKKNLQKRKEK